MRGGATVTVDLIVARATVPQVSGNGSAHTKGYIDRVVRLSRALEAERWHGRPEPAVRAETTEKPVIADLFDEAAEIRELQLLGLL